MVIALITIWVFWLLYIGLKSSWDSSWVILFVFPIFASIVIFIIHLFSDKIAMIVGVGTHVPAILWLFYKLVSGFISERKKRKYTIRKFVRDLFSSLSHNANGVKKNSESESNYK